MRHLNEIECFVKAVELMIFRGKFSSLRVKIGRSLELQVLAGWDSLETAGQP